jgi:hypothetical protein
MKDEIEEKKEEPKEMSLELGSEKKITTSFADLVKWIGGGIMLGTIWAQFQAMQVNIDDLDAHKIDADKEIIFEMRINELDARLQKKIKRQSERDERVRHLEKNVHCE